ncbi:MAG: glycerate kinase [Variovorax sp.]
MNLRRILVPLGGLVLLGLAWKNYGWPGVALVSGAIVMFLLMHFNRTMQVMKRAANRPIGYADSAVMLNAKLKAGVTLLHTMALTRAIGELRSPKDQQPELYRWTDAGGSWVDAEFHGGKLRQWTLTRPERDESQDSAYQPPIA